MSKRKYVVSIDDYRRAQDEYVDRWQTLDDCLYRLCRENPVHGSRLSVNAKTHIIGRTYQTGIERKIRSTGKQGSSMSQVADLFYARHEILDHLLARLANISQPLAASNVSEILEIHGYIVALMREITIDGQSPRSFVAKYGHFHNRVFPIYDANAAEVAWSLVSQRAIDGDQIAVPDVADPYYAGYVRRLLILQQQLMERGIPVTVRSLDYYLVWEHDNRLISRKATAEKVEEKTAPIPQSEELEANG